MTNITLVSNLFPDDPLGNTSTSYAVAVLLPIIFEQ